MKESDKKRVYRWRESHPEEYRRYMKRYMRDYRAGLKRKKK